MAPENLLIRHGVSLFLSASLLLSLLPPSTGQFIAGQLGVTYDSHSPYGPVESGGDLAINMGFTAIRLIGFDGASIMQFSEAPISMHLDVNSTIIAPLASNESFATSWIDENVMTGITYGTVCVGNDAIPGPNAGLVLPAIKNLRRAWLNYPDLPDTWFSTAFSFTRVIRSPNPPSSAEFDKDIAERYMIPLLQFLSSTNSAFMIDLFPYEMVAHGGEFSKTFALFEGNVAEYVSDNVTGCLYTNLFDLMYDAVVTATIKLGFKNVSVIVTGTGWPGTMATGELLEGANNVRAAEYFGRLINHVNSGKGTPLRPNQPLDVFYHSLYDLPGKKGEPARSSFGIGWIGGYPKYNLNRHSGTAEHEHRFSEHASLPLILLLLLLTTILMLFNMRRTTTSDHANR